MRFGVLLALLIVFLFPVAYAFFTDLQNSKKHQQQPLVEEKKEEVWSSMDISQVDPGDTMRLVSPPSDVLLTGFQVWSESEDPRIISIVVDDTNTEVQYKQDPEKDGSKWSFFTLAQPLELSPEQVIAIVKQNTSSSVVPTLTRLHFGSSSSLPRTVCEAKRLA